jgi:tetratricopeptide (TPR) repeat protein
MAIILPLLSFGSKEPVANTYYAKGQFKEAVGAYQQIINSGFQSAAVYYNLGNAYYKLGEIPSALLYYEKAHKLSPGDEDINFNIRFANLKTTDKIDETPEFFLTKWWHEFILGASVNALVIISILLALLGSAILIVYFFTNSVGIKRASFYISIILFCVSVLTIFIAHRQVDYFSGHKQAIIFAGIVNIKSGPAEQAATLFVLHEGTKVNLLDNNNGWVRVKLINGNQGWIKMTDVKEI